MRSGPTSAGTAPLDMRDLAMAADGGTNFGCKTTREMAVGSVWTRGMSLSSHVSPTPSEPGPSVIGQRMTYEDMDFTLTESETAECIALRGVLPDAMSVAGGFTYANLSGTDGMTLSRESNAGQSWWYLGAWIYPFELRIRRE